LEHVWDESELFEPFNHLVEPENRIAYIAPPTLLKDAYSRTYRRGLSSIFVADEDVSPAWHGFDMNIVLKDIISLKASQLVESGILPNVLSEIRRHKLTKPEEIGPQVLTLRHLEAGFVVIFVLLGVSFVAFVVECAMKQVKKRRSR
jgi:hypothetical protein